MANKATIVHNRSLQVVVLMFFCWNGRLVIAQYPDVTANDTTEGCPIPPGMHNDQWYRSYVSEPHAGGLCKNFSFLFTQRWSWRCQTTYCCGEPCDCNTSVSDFPSDCKSGNIISKLCYIVVLSLNNYKYVCCPGFHEDANKVCIPDDPCVNNTLGCQFECLTMNGISRCTCPPGYLLNPADIKNTTCLEVKTTTPIPLLLQTDTSPAFPAQYVAAAVVGGLVFVGLLVGLLVYFCRPHPEIAPAVVIVGDEIKKKFNDDDVDIVVVGKKHLEDDDFIDEKKKDPLYETIKETGGKARQGLKQSPTQQQPASGEVDLTSGGHKAQPNIYTSLAGRTPAVRPGIGDLSTSGTDDGTDATPVRYVVSDLNSDYAEIVTEQDLSTRI